MNTRTQKAATEFSSTALVESSEVLAVEASCTDHELTVILDDGRTVSVPLVSFPRLLTASPKQRKDWELIGGGIGLHWEAIDEDISVASLLQPEKFMRMPNAAMQPPRFSAQALRVPSAHKKRSPRRA